VDNSSNGIKKNLFIKLFILINLLLVLLLLSVSVVYSLDRCEDYVQPIRTAYFKYFGVDFPYWYGVGCAKAESNCRQNIVSFDQGIGLFQLTPSTGIIKDIEKGLKERIDPYILKDNIKGHAYWMSYIWNKNMELKTIIVKGRVVNVQDYVARCGKKLSDMYIMYNGGWWYMYEASFTTSCDKQEIIKYCKRKKIPLKNDKILDLCEVNYSYADKIYKFSIPYRLSNKDSNLFKY